MFDSSVGKFLKRHFDCNDFPWTMPLPFWAGRRERQVRQLRMAARRVLRRRLLRERGLAYLITSASLWPLVSVVKAWLHVMSGGFQRRLVPALLDCWWLQFAHNLRIADQRYFGFELPEQRARFLLFVTYAEHTLLMEHMNRRARPERVRDKTPFTYYCQSKGLPCAPLLAKSDGGERAAVTYIAPFPEQDLFLKASMLWGGKGAHVLYHLGEAHQGWRADDGSLLPTAESIAGFAAQKLGNIPWLLQTRLLNGPSTRPFSPGALLAVRVITARKGPQGDIVVIGGLMRFPRAGAVVDNLAVGGMATDCDPVTGRLGKIHSAYDRSCLLSHHPDTGACIEGVNVPHWDRLVALAKRAHSELDDLVMIGWDIALPDDEPVLIEANTNWGVLLDTPLGATDYVEIMLAPENHERVFGRD